MARNIQAQVLGGQSKMGIEAETVADVLKALGLTGTYTASINGEPAEMSDEVDDYMFVSFAPAVKGGR